MAAQQGQSPASPAQGAHIAATPVIVHLKVGDSAQTRVVEARNEGAGETQLRFYLGDWEQDESGAFKFLPYGTGPHGCGKRMESFPDGAVLRGGERQQVQVQLAGGAGVCWAMLFVESMPQGKGPVKVVERVGIKLLNTPPGTPRGGEVAEVTARTGKADTVHVRVLFDNTGQAPLDLVGRVEIRDYSGHVLRQSEFGPFGSLPARRRWFDVDVVGKLASGDYVAVPIVDFGGDYLAGGQATFKVP